MLSDDPVAKARNRFKRVVRQEELSILRTSCVDPYESYGCDADDEYPNTNVEHNNAQSFVDKRQNLEINPNDARRTCTLRLFDRAVDVAQFQELTPLYPICRAWTKNLPGSRKNMNNNMVSRDGDVTTQGERSVKEIHQLPDPKPLPTDAFGNEIKIRVPAPLSPPEEKGRIWDYINGHASGGENRLPAPAVLFQDHLNRWVAVRQRWKRAAAFNESRYKDSFDVLRSIQKDLDLPR